MATSERAGMLTRLPSTFRYTDARRLCISDHALRELRRTGQIEQIGRGVYRRADAQLADEDLLEIAIKIPDATLCLGTALARHDLTDEIPHELDIALPRDAWRASVRVPVRYHGFAHSTFGIGRELLPLDDSASIGLYSAERSIVDAFRLRHIEGSDLAYEALRRWVRRGGQPSVLMEIAQAFPRTMTSLRTALEILL
jgi:predicted transcriptional regulator of viral defense system